MPMNDLSKLIHTSAENADIIEPTGSTMYPTLPRKKRRKGYPVFQFIFQISNQAKISIEAENTSTKKIKR